MVSLTFQILDFCLFTYIGLKEGIAAILIYITIFALLVRKGLRHSSLGGGGGGWSLKWGRGSLSKVGRVHGKSEVC